MSEQEKTRSTFMQELDEWSMANVIEPVLAASRIGSAEREEAIWLAQKAIREKVLESYRNGQIAGPRPPAQMPRRVAVPKRQ